MGTKTLDRDQTDVIDIDQDSYQIIVWNDDHNTFEHVIKTFVDVLDHSEPQAEQCAMIIHNTGKCGVKNGTYDYLKPLTDAITDRGISATLEEK